MRIAVFSCIHGNLPALKAVLEHAETLQVNHFFILGDLIGYYLNPKEVIEEISNIENKDVIQGNHERFIDKVLNNEMQIEVLNKRYGEGHYKAIKTLTNSQIDWLRYLPKEKDIVVDGLQVKLCHGAPENPDKYLYPTTEKTTLKNNCIEGYDFIFIGHSHYPFNYTHNGCHLINVGSAGMSKDIGSLASWGILDTENRVYIPCRTPYTVTTVENDLEESCNSNKKYLFSVHRRNRLDIDD